MLNCEETQGIYVICLADEREGMHSVLEERWEIEK